MMVTVFSLLELQGGPLQRLYSLLNAGTKMCLCWESYILGRVPTEEYKLP